MILARDSRSSEKFMHGIKVLMAKNYIDNLSEKTQKGVMEKAAQGIKPFFAPLGYRNVDGPNGQRIIEPDPLMAPPKKYVRKEEIASQFGEAFRAIQFDDGERDLSKGAARCIT